MTYKTVTIKLELNNAGYSLMIDDWHVGNFRTVGSLIEKLCDRLRSIFH